MTTEDLVAGVSFVWSAAHGDGRLLSNNDLVNGELIRPMAAGLSDNWNVLGVCGRAGILDLWTGDCGTGSIFNR